MKLYLVRHGETTFNNSSLHQHGDVELSPSGAKQAEILARRFSRIPVDIVYSSPFQRAKHTTEIINKHLNGKILLCDFLKEGKNPSEIIGKDRRSSEVKKIKQTIQEKSDDPFWHYSDEENFVEFKSRVLQFFPLLEKEEGKNVLAVSHSGVIRMLILFMLFGEGFNFDTYTKFKIFKLNNTGITLCERDNDRQWSVRAFNDHSHLG